MVLKILTFPNPALKLKAKKVKHIDGQTMKLIEDMKETMYEAGGAGLAAIQVGVPLSIFVWDVSEQKDAPQFIINPKIIAKEGVIEFEEGCLSIPGLKLSLKRSLKVSVKGVNGRGEEITLEGEGFESVIFQHEIDHLNGILFIDRLPVAERRAVKKLLLESGEYNA